jgi:molybdopterin-guanine dinucleotide biosynthesis protein
MSVHAMDEMAEDNLDIVDIEHADLNGHLDRTERDDSRGRDTSSKERLLMSERRLASSGVLQVPAAPS